MKCGYQQMRSKPHYTNYLSMRSANEVLNGMPDYALCPLATSVELCSIAVHIQCRIMRLVRE